MSSQASSPGSISQAVSSLSASSGPDAFAPGTVLLNRYRIAGLLGKGGMGEVYRADDLTLGQPVALKFLPEELLQAPERLQRFRDEVRLARQVSNPHVCRVYDIGDLNGRPFLSMELIEGQDLAGMLRSIGRFSQDKAIEIARQLCAGLAAAHKVGILHRDLKPANVMLDAKGNVHITDFGLARAVHELQPGEGRVGTPAYMSPEQLAGQPMTQQSDIYSLGLILYELLTGRRPFAAKSMDELSQMQSSQMLDSPSSLVEGIDAATERAILRCLEADPSQRPASALAVAASLPGGDPLAAALEAGEVPTADMVAASSAQGTLKPGLAWTLFLATLVMLAVLGGMSKRYWMVSRIQLPKSAPVLADRAQEIRQRLGLEPGGDQAVGFAHFGTYVRHLERTDSTSARWQPLSRSRPPAMLFWYRTANDHLAPRSSLRSGPTYSDPPLVDHGMSRVTLDPQGRLWGFDWVPDDTDSMPGAPLAFDPDIFLELAGIDASRFETTSSVWVPDRYCNERLAWLGSFETDPDMPIRLEAGLLHGRPVHFGIYGPWSTPASQRVHHQTAFSKFAGFFTVFMVIFLLITSALRARSNLKHGRGDRTGATSLAAFVFGIMFVEWLLLANHTSSLQAEWDMLLPNLALMIFIGTIFWTLYLALEPFMRQLWPQRIISWTRLLRGQWKDPLVARDFLIGTVCAGVVVLLDLGEHVLPVWIGKPPPIPEYTTVAFYRGFLPGLANLLNGISGQMFGPLALAFGLVGFKFLVRNVWVAGILTAGLVSIFSGGQSNAVLGMVLAYVAAAVMVVVLLRWGVLALVVGVTFGNLLDHFPLTFDFSLWYAPTATMAAVLTVLLAAYGLRYSIRQR